MVALPSRPAHENRYLNASEPLTDLSGSSFEPPTCPVILMCAAFATQLRPISAAAWPSQVQPQVGQRARPKACRCSKHTLLAHSQACSVRPPARAGRTRRAAQGQLRQPGADRRPEQDCPGRGPHRRSLCSRPTLAGASHARFLARVPPGKETGSLRRRCCAWETLPGWMSYVACRVLRHVMCYMLCVACSMLQRFVRCRSWRGCVAGSQRRVTRAIVLQTLRERGSACSPLEVTV